MESPAFDFTGCAEHTAKTDPVMNGLVLDFSEASIAGVDAFFGEMWGEEGAAPGAPSWVPSDGKRAVILGYGCYLGEVLRRRYGGTWVQDPERPTNLPRAQLRLPGDITAYPIAAVYQRFKEGAARKLEVLVMDVRRRLAAGEPGPADAAAWCGQGEAFSRMGRHDLARPFFVRALAADPASETARRREEECRQAEAIQTAVDSSYLDVR